MKIIILGAGGHAKVIIDLLKEQKQIFSDEIYVLDDVEEIGHKVSNCKIIGKISDCIKYKKEAQFIIGIGNNRIRKQISEQYKLPYLTLVHPSAVISATTEIGEGTVVMAGAVLQAESRIGKHCIVNTCASIDHESEVCDYVHISPGVRLGGQVKIGIGSWLGIGCCIKNNTCITCDCTIGAGSVVLKSILIPGVYYGTPVKLYEQEKRMKKMLILATVPSMIGQFNMSNIHILRQLGCEVHVACNFKDTTVWKKEQTKVLLKNLELNNVICHQINISRNPINIIDNGCAYSQLFNIFKNEKYDFIHCHTPVGGVLGRVVSKRTGTKVIYTAHGFHFYKGSSLLSWLLFYPIEFWLSHYTDILITINKEDYLLAGNRLKAKRTEYVPGVGIELKKFNSTNKFDIRKKIRENMAINNDTKLLISVGELSRRKNHLTIIKAIEKIKEIAPDLDLRYYIIGSGALEAKIQHEIIRKDLSEQILLLGYRTNVAEFLEAADVFVFPSRQEGLPVALLEAMATGLPVVCSNIRGNSDLILDKQGGMLICANNEMEFAKKILELLRNEEKMLNFGEFNKALVQRYSCENVHSKMKGIYQDII